MHYHELNICNPYIGQFTDEYLRFLTSRVYILKDGEALLALRENAWLIAGIMELHKKWESPKYRADLIKRFKSLGIDYQRMVARKYGEYAETEYSLLIHSDAQGTVGSIEHCHNKNDLYIAVADAIYGDVLSATDPADKTMVQEIMEVLLDTGEIIFEGDPPLYLVKEFWPFHDETSGAYIQENKYYAFGDAGGLAGSFDGYDNLQQCVDAVSEDHDSSDFTYKRDELGSSAITILTGREFVNRLYELGGTQDYGKWSEHGTPISK
ncbi:hypothetical protein [Ralstonia phage RP13]|nr:hypothetical protein [Ralstonia phage RP13]